jgi:hypothetical protein
MAEKVISYKVKIVNEGGQVVESLATSFEDLSKSVGDLSKELDKADFGTENFKELQTELKKSQGALKEAQQSTMSLGEKFASIPGPVGAAAQSIQGLGTAFKALIMNPIGAVIAALGLVFVGLYKALTSTEKGLFALNQVMGALSGLLTPIISLFQDMAMVLVDGVIAGIKGVQAALEFLGFEQFAQGSRDAEALAIALNQIEEAEGDLAVARAKQNKELAEAREILSDTNLTLAERTKALNEVKKSEEDLAEKETQLAQKRLDAVREQMRLKGRSTELLDAEEQAEISLYNTQQSQAAVRRKNIKLEQSLKKEAAAADKAARDEAEKAAKEKEQKETDRLKKLEEARKFEQDLNLAIIRDENEKARQTIEIQKQALLKQIEALSVSEEKKTELRLKAQEDANIKLEKLETDNQGKKDAKETENNQKEYDRQMALTDALLQLDQIKYENQKNLTEQDLQLTIDLMMKKKDLLLQNDKLTAEERLLIETQFQGAVFKLKKDQTEREALLEKQQLTAIADGFGSIATLAGETSAVGRLAGVAQASVNTYLSASEAYKSTVGIPVVGPVLAPIAAAAAIAAGLATVNKIMSVDTPTTKVSKPTFAYGGIVQGQGSMTTDSVNAYLSPGEAVINARSTAMFKPLLSSINTLGGGKTFTGGVVSNGVDMGQVEMLNTLRSNNKQPIKAYVVSSEMTNQAMLDRATKSRSLI